MSTLKNSSYKGGSLKVPAFRPIPVSGINWGEDLNNVIYNHYIKGVLSKEDLIDLQLHLNYYHTPSLPSPLIELNSTTTLIFNNIKALKEKNKITNNDIESLITKINTYPPLDDTQFTPTGDINTNTYIPEEKTKEPIRVTSTDKVDVISPLLNIIEDQYLKRGLPKEELQAFNSQLKTITPQNITEDTLNNKFLNNFYQLISNHIKANKITTDEIQVLTQDIQSIIDTKEPIVDETFTPPEDKTFKSKGYNNGR